MKDQQKRTCCSLEKKTVIAAATLQCTTHNDDK